MHDRLLISFSGGRTSAYMTVLLVALCKFFAVEFLVVFANTGQEDERTLVFVDRCDKAFALGIVWVESVVDPRMGVGTSFRIVNFETATRSGAVFEAVIAKYGIPNTTYLHCNRELKLRPIHAYVQTYGWDRGTYDTAIGIRADEIDRQNANAKAERLIYPLIRLGTKKPAIIRWWRRQLFDLNIPEHMGNCLWCWKKTERKLLTLATERPEVFDFPARMEALYPFAGAGDGTPRRFFRKNWTTLDIKARARLPFEPFVDGKIYDDPELDGANGCSESCDPHADGVVYGDGDLFAASEGQ